MQSHCVRIKKRFLELLRIFPLPIASESLFCIKDRITMEEYNKVIITLKLFIIKTNFEA